jgi:hypothetical protein
MNRTALRLAFLLVGTVSLGGAMTAGCGGGNAAPDGGDARFYRDATVNPDAKADAKKDGSTDASTDTASAVPPIGAGSKLIASGSVELIGSGTDTCTNQVPASGDRWCGFSKLAADLVNNELWIVNVSKVAAGATVVCDSTVADPNCLRLSTGLFADPSSGFRIHGFDGDTLTYSEIPSMSAGGFLGAIFAWRPGWAAPHNISGATGMVCNGNAKTAAAVCLENPVPDSSNTFVHTAELHAGFLDEKGASLPLVDTVILVAKADAAGVKKWGARLSPDGKSVAWSTRAMDSGTEDLKWQNLNDDASRATVATDVDQWTISSDAKKWYWLKSFNYDTAGAPAGTLQSAPYPDPGAAAVTIATAVGDFNEAGTGLLYRTKVMNDMGTLLLTPDRDVPATVKAVDTGVSFVFGTTSDGKSSTYTKNIQSPATNVFLFDVYVGNSAGAMPCTLTATATAFLPPTFLAGGGLVAWGQFNKLTQEIEGLGTTIATCATKKFASDIFDWTAIGDEGIVFLDTINPDPAVNEATLRYAKITQATLPAVGTVVQTRAGLNYATLLPSLPAVLYLITSNTSADGLYLNATLPFTVTAPVPTDGGTPETGGGSDAGGGGDTGGGADGGASDGGASDSQPGG